MFNYMPIGFKHSEETKRKIGLKNRITAIGNTSHLGFKHTEESRRKISDGHKGLTVWNKGLKGMQVAWNKGVPCADDTKKKLSLKNTGRVLSEETKSKISRNNAKWSLGKTKIDYPQLANGGRKIGGTPWNKGIPNYQMRGENHPNWKGGVTTLQEKIRKSLDYQLWRTAVFERDDYRCLDCGERGGQLNADHILPFAYFPRLRFDINNGQTLCKPCHKKTSTYGSKAKNYQLTN